MAETRHNHPSLLLDLLIVAAGAALLIVALRFGLEAGEPPTKGAATVLGGLYIIYLGVLFLLSYFFSDACYVFSFLSYLCEVRSHPAGRHMAIIYFAVSLIVGSWCLLIGLGVL
jgi:hypothetical protein